MCSNQRTEDGRRRTEIGQTLVESLLAIAVAVLVVTALVGVGISSMRSASFGKNQAEAVRLASQNLEVLQSKRDADWGAFYGVATGCTSSSKCCYYYAGSYQLQQPTDVAHCKSGDVSTSFWSTSSTLNVSVDVTSTASFSEGSTLRTVTINRTFSNWR